MAQKLIINTRCPFCGNEVEKVSDGMLKSQPDEYDVEYVITHLGYKRYLHTSCWNRMIENQKKRRKLTRDLCLDINSTYICNIYTICYRYNCIVK